MTVNSLPPKEKKVKRHDQKIKHLSKGIGMNKTKNISSATIDPQYLEECKKMGFSEDELQRLKQNDLENYMKIMMNVRKNLGANSDKSEQKVNIHIDGFYERNKH